MKCERCTRAGLKSKLYIGGSITTLLARGDDYYDENGKFIDDNPNTITTSYSCTNGHSFQVVKKLTKRTTIWT